MVSAKFIVSKTTNNLLTEAPELVEYLQHYASFITGVFSTGKYNKKIVAEYSHIHARGGGGVLPYITYSWVACDVTKNQTKKLSILLSFYFHEVLQHLKIFT